MQQGRPTQATGVQEGTRLLGRDTYLCPCGHITYLGLKQARKHARSKDCEQVQMFGLRKITRRM